MNPLNSPAGTSPLDPGYDFNEDPWYVKPLRWKCMCKRVWYCGCVVECCESNYGQNDIYHEASVHRCSKCGTERPPGAYGDSQREWSEVCCSRCGLSRPQEPERGLYYPNATLTVAERANLTAYTLLLVASSLLFLASFLVTAWCLVAIAQAPLPFSEYPFSDRFIDRTSTRLNSSHLGISYAVFCLKKKKNDNFKRPCLQMQFSRQFSIRMLAPR